MRDTLFLGYQADVAPFYAAFDAMVLPSANEGTPVSAIESLAAGRPVVATRVGGVPDVVARRRGRVPRRAGRHRGAGGPAGRARPRPGAARPHGPAGHKRVLPRYAVDRLVADIDELYRSLLAAKGIVPS